MTDIPDESAAEARLRAMLSSRAEELPATEAPYGDIVRRGRAARQRGRVALGAGLALLVALPGSVFAAQQFGGQQSVTPGGGPDGPAGTPEPQEAAGPGTSGTSGEGGSEDGTGTGTEEQAVPEGTVQPPSDPARQLLDGITLEQAQADVMACIDDQWVNNEAPLLGGTPAPDPDDLRILVAWQGHGGENQGPGPIRRVMVVDTDPDPTANHNFVCSKWPDDDTGFYGFYNGFSDRVELKRMERVVDANSSIRYETAEGGIDGDWEMPFRWVKFGAFTEEVAEVTVEYGGTAHEVVYDAGFFLASGVLEETPGAYPVLKAYDAEGGLLYDSTEDPLAWN
ncbi:hypothetical protein [Streptomyces sp. YIM 98790]|uniref:hypothetical protein n=1 Tax=Streptomyces sp. YIM 98790 TaxID=2689077 RepID=UPI00140CD0E4|nr:hypothetical protein [Streptomyces sp. YIM 98790]